MSLSLTPAQASDLLTGFQDHARFCRESLKLRNLAGSIVPLELSPGQLKLHAAIEHQRRRNEPIRLAVLKTRRSWFTTGVCAEMFHEIPFFPGRKGTIIADRYDPAGLEAFDYLQQFQRGYSPFGLGAPGTRIKLPKLLKDSEQKLEWSNASSIEVLSADRGEIRGGGRHFVLGDELAFWRAAGTTLTGLLNMVPKLPGTMVVLQSTANGVGGEFYDICQQSRDPARSGGWQFLFFGWTEHPIYRAPLVVQPAAFQDSLDYEERYLLDRHGVTLEQLNWRRMTIATECRGKIDLFHQEYPSTPEEAFLSSGRPALDMAAIARMEVSNGAPGELQVIEEFPRRKLRFVIRDHGALTVWKKPEPGHQYIIGADPSQGKDVSASQRGSDPDWSVGFVIDQHDGEQVAMLRERLRPNAFAEYLALLGELYNWAFLVPEANDAGFIDALVREYKVGLIYNRRRDPTDRRSTLIQEIGFQTTTVTRQWLISALDDAIREMAITIRSAVTVDECQNFIIKPNGKAEHRDDHHDDCVMAAALAAIGLRYAPRKPVVLGSAGRPAMSYGPKPAREEKW